MGKNKFTAINEHAKVKLHDKVIYNSMTGSVTAKIIAVGGPYLSGEIERVTLRSTSRSNKCYPAGFEWEVPAGAASLVLRP